MITTQRELIIAAVGVVDVNAVLVTALAVSGRRLRLLADDVAAFGSRDQFPVSKFSATGPSTWLAQSQSKDSATEFFHPSCQVLGHGLCVRSEDGMERCATCIRIPIR